MILCCGEALIDFLPIETDSGETVFQAFNGGSIYNVAIALGRLGRPVGFHGGLSTDFFGEQLASGLEASNVDISYAIRSERPSTLAFVRFQGGEPAYAIIDEGSAGRMLTEEELPTLPDDVWALHFGSISLIYDPAGASLEMLARKNHGKRVISFDPNIRPDQIKDRDAYMRRFEAMVGIADIIKLSDADMDWIAPSTSIDVMTDTWIQGGAKTVAVTRGSRGATLHTADGVIECDPVQVSVADTIGAGDTFMAGLLSALDKRGVLNVSAIARLDREILGDALNYAVLAASITVARPGANPPWEHEV